MDLTGPPKDDDTSRSAAEHLSERVGARPPLEDDPRIDGMLASLVLEPVDEEQCARALELCHDENLGTVPVGGGTRLPCGNLPARLDAVLSTVRLAGVEDHIPGDLTVAVRAGTTLADLNAALSAEGQFLAMDAPLPSVATIGGVLAAGEPGLRRRPGARPRDLLLGVEAVLADGTPVKAGGRVVKNVAGYELMKLLVGSMGTLAVITRAFLRLRALPEDVTTVCALFSTAADAEACWRGLMEQGVAPEMAVLLNPNASSRHGLADWSLLLRFEGLREETRGAVRDVRDRARFEVLDEPPWNAIRDFPVEPASGLGLRGSVAPADTFRLAEAWQDGGPLQAHPDSGLVYSRTTDVEALADRHEKASSLRAAVTLERAPRELKSGVDVFGERPASFALMERIKRQLDPTGVLAPGRFVGRL